MNLDALVLFINTRKGMGRLLEKGRHGAGPRPFISFDNKSFENKGRVFKDVSIIIMLLH